MFPAKLAVVLLGGGVFALAGCQTASHTNVTFHDDGQPRHEHPHQDWWHYQFVYYPNDQVYFEPYTRTWFWNEQGQWQEGDTLPQFIGVNPDHAKIVYLKTPTPHAQHRTVIAAAGYSVKPYTASTWPPTSEGTALTQASDE